MDKIVIIGAGQAAAAACAKLRAEGFAGQITLVGEEPVPPYQRPPLSKAYLLGEMAEDRLYLRPATWYAENEIDLRTGLTAERIDPAAREVHLTRGEALPYDALLIATGAAPRHLPAAIGGSLKNVHVMRTLEDADRMAPAFTERARALIIGGGYIGLEAAAVAAKRGLTVTLVEMADRILQRVAAPETSSYFRDLHQRHGVDIREGVGLDRLTGEDVVTGAILSDGTELALDLVVVGIGIAPRTSLAESAGLTCDSGIVTDSQCRTSDPAIWAAGDCATCTIRGQQTRIESVGNAIDQGENAALNMLGRDVAYDPKPWFWSDQYDVKLQIAGLNASYTHVVVRQDGDAVSHWYYANETLIAVDAMNDPRNYMIGKRLIEAGKSPDPALIADPAADMKSLLRA